MAIEGELAVTMRWNGQRVQGVAVRSTRPDAVQRLLCGRTPAAAVDLVTRLFSICGSAQGAVAAAALEAAQHTGANASVQAARAAAIRLETVQEHCQRIGMDWAQAMGEPPRVAFVRSVRAIAGPAIARLLDHALRDGPALDVDRAEREALAEIRPAVERALLGMQAHAWLAQAGAAPLQSWATTGVAPARWYATLQAKHATLGASAIALMPAVDANALRLAVLPAWQEDPRFATRPAWNGIAVETGAIARMASHPLVADLLARNGTSVAVRLIARLTELAALLAARPGRAAAGTAPGDAVAASAVVPFAHEARGCAVTQTARGVLVHRAAVERGVIRDYAILAPTEWNFRADGALTSALARIETDDADALARDARLVAQAIDPCVACRVEVAHA